MWQIVGELVAGGVTVFLTTQNLDEADRLADRVAVLDHGRLVAEGTPAQLKRRIPGGHARLYFHDLQGVEAASRILGEGARDDEALLLQVPNEGTPQALTALLERLQSQAVCVERVTVHLPDLDDVFLALTGSADPPLPSEVLP